MAVASVTLALAAASTAVSAQRGRGGQAGPALPPATPRAGAPVDLTGTWVSIVTEDWRWRMVTPPKGDVASVPVNPEGRKVAQAWDLAADNAAGNQCKAFGVGGVMRQPGRLRISWQDDSTLKLEFDAGTQTRLLSFDRTQAAGTEKTWQGYSRAEWEIPPGAGRLGGSGPGLTITGVPGGGGVGLRGGPPPRGVASIYSGGNLKVVTTGFREGYLRKNGVPYSESATLTEYIHRLPPHPNGDHWLQVVTIVEDPRYLTQPFYTSTNFRLEPDGSKFTPTPCRTEPPLPQKK
jgi:hypothetical protein